MPTDFEILKSKYVERTPRLRQAADLIKSELTNLFEGVHYLDFISVRVKGIDRFLEKAVREENGKPKYNHPLDDIQDQIGVRIVVRYKSEIPQAKERLLESYREIEDVDKEVKDHTKFGYAGVHLICFLPSQIQKETNCGIKFFEVQLFTLFQHAWAEANHDLGYKSDSDLDYETNKLIHFTAAQAWGADKIFDQLWCEKKNKKAIDKHLAHD